MAIKIRKLLFTLIVISGVIIMISPSLNPSIKTPSITSHPQNDITLNRLNTNSYEYICKVFTFTPTQNNYILQFSLLKNYMHSIIVEMVSPHQCDINITIQDSYDRKFHIFYANISQNYGEFSIPFGTAVGGTHTFQFTVNTTQNLNIKIKIVREDINCLYDKIDMFEHGSIIFYEVSCFSDGFTITHEVTLQTDRRYTFYVGRVSSISSLLTAQGRIRFDIYDLDAILFKIYENDTLATVASVNIFRFGTAMAGEYSFNIQIFCEVEWMNLGYAIVDDGSICNPPQENTTQNDLLAYFSIPIDWGLGTIIGIGIITGAIIIFVAFYKKKSGAGLNLK